MTYDLIALGETMMTLLPPAGETLRSARTLVVDHAGAESNTCVGLARLGFRVAWVSRLGEDVVRGADRLGALQATGEWMELDVRREDAVDPIGAGDAFNAGYLAVRLRGGSIGDALRAGARCGMAVATSLGDTAGFPRTIDSDPSP